MLIEFDTFRSLRTLNKIDDLIFIHLEEFSCFEMSNSSNTEK